MGRKSHSGDEVAKGVEDTVRRGAKSSAELLAALGQSAPHFSRLAHGEDYTPHRLAGAWKDYGW